MLDAMSGSGVRTLRYVLEGGASFVLANELMEGEHPLEANLAPLVADGRQAGPFEHLKGCAACTEGASLPERTSSHPAPQVQREPLRRDRRVPPWQG